MGLLATTGLMVPISLLALEGTGFAGEKLTVGGEIRGRYEFRDNADFNANVNDTLSFISSRVRLHASYELTPDFAFFLQIQDSRLLGSEASTASNEKNLDLHQGYFMVKNLAGPLALTFGRQEMVYGDSRLVGNFGWSNIGRSFDGLRLTYLQSLYRADFWAMVTKVFGPNTGPDPAFSPSNNESQQFYGLYSSIKADPVSIEPYLMYLRDTGNAAEVDASGNLVSPITAPAARGQNRVTIGLRINGKGGKGIGDAVDFTGEAAYQLGTMDARGTTPKSDISAYALAVKAGYTLPLTLMPRLGVEYDRASGDKDPTDDRAQTFENLFPTNHIHYGIMDYVGWRNMQDLRFSLGIKPGKASGVGLDYHLFSLAEKADNWYRASGAPFFRSPPGNSKSDLGQEIDLVAYTIVKEKLRLEAGYGHFFRGDYVKVNFPTTNHDSDFGYLQAGIGF